MTVLPRHLFKQVCIGLSLLFMGTAWLGCANPSPSGIYYVSGEGAVTPDGLHQVLWKPFKTSFVRPGARFQDYQQVIIDPASIHYGKKPSPGRIAYNSIEPIYKLSPEALASIKQAYAESLEIELVRSGRFRQVDSPAPGTLRIRGYILDLVVTAPPMRDQPADASSIVSDSGQMTLALDVIDAETGQALLRVADRKQIQDDRHY